MWKTALERASHIFGLTPSPLLNAANLAKFCGDTRAAAAAAAPKAGALVKQLRSVPPAFISGDPTKTQRMETAVEAVSTLNLIAQHDGAVLVEQFGTVPLSATPAAIGTSLSSAETITAGLQGMSWDILDGLHSATGEHAATAQSILAGVSEALASYEHANPLKTRLHDSQKAAVALLKAMATKPTPPVLIAPPEVPPTVVVPPSVTPAQDEVVLVMPAECSALLSKHKDVSLDLAAGTLTIPAIGRTFKLRIVTQS